MPVSRAPTLKRPICIFRPDDPRIDATVHLGNLFTPDIQDHKVAVISVAGRFRQGKSFLLNFFIRYLRAAGESNWLEKDAELELEGFDWKHTQRAVTSGVLIWPEIFKMRDSSGEEIVVLLMDSQGVFDANLSIKDSKSIFSLSVLLSSTQIFNVKQNIQGDDLSQLELFVEFGRLVSSGSAREKWGRAQKPFQNLIYLVRDWAYPAENNYGWEGGKEVLDSVFEVENAGEELAAMRTSIKGCFESITGFLMPHPGKKVDTSSEFRGKLQDMEPDFVQGIKTFIEDVLRPSNLKPKIINGKELTIREFAQLVGNYSRELHSGEYPQPERLFQATARAWNDAVVHRCFTEYETLILKHINDQPREPDSFDVFHKYVLTNILNFFKQSRKMGGTAAVAKAEKNLIKRIESAKQHFRQFNFVSYEKKRGDEWMQKMKDYALQAVSVVALIVSLVIFKRP